MKKNLIWILVAAAVVVLVAGLAIVFGGIGKKTSQPGGGAPVGKNLSQEKIDFCATFPKEKIAELLGKTISKSKTGSNEFNKAPSCFYYLENTAKTVYLELNQNSNVKNQTEGAKALGWTVSQNTKIPLKNYVVISDLGKIRFIYLIIDNQTFLSIDAWGSNITDDEQINFAAKLAEYLGQEFGVK
jgi:hypothetical protein